MGVSYISSVLAKKILFFEFKYILGLTRGGEQSFALDDVSELMVVQPHLSLCRWLSWNYLKQIYSSNDFSLVVFDRWNRNLKCILLWKSFTLDTVKIFLKELPIKVIFFLKNELKVKREREKIVVLSLLIYSWPFTVVNNWFYS